MNNAVFWKTIKNVKKNKDTQLVRRERRWNYLVSETNYCITKFFTDNLLEIEMKKKEILMNKPVRVQL